MASPSERRPFAGLSRVKPTIGCRASEGPASASFTVTATDSAGYTGSQSYSLTIDQAALTITADSTTKTTWTSTPAQVRPPAQAALRDGYTGSQRCAAPPRRPGRSPSRSRPPTPHAAAR
jgi:hypothetical protein